MSVTDKLAATRQQIEIHELRHAAIKRAAERDLGAFRMTHCFMDTVTLIFERGKESYQIPRWNQNV